MCFLVMGFFALSTFPRFIRVLMRVSALLLLWPDGAPLYGCTVLTYHQWLDIGVVPLWLL